MRTTSLSTEDQVRLRLHGQTRSCSVEMIPGGPALVRGATGVEDDDGTRHDASRPVVAVCTCGLTQRGPWCDATHKFSRQD